MAGKPAKAGTPALSSNSGDASSRVDRSSTNKSIRNASRNTINSKNACWKFLKTWFTWLTVCKYCQTYIKIAKMAHIYWILSRFSPILWLRKYRKTNTVFLTCITLYVGSFPFSDSLLNSYWTVSFEIFAIKTVLFTSHLICVVSLISHALLTLYSRHKPNMSTGTIGSNSWIWQSFVRIYVKVFTVYMYLHIC